MNSNQLFKQIPPLELFEKLVKIYGLSDINDCRKFTKDNLIKNKTLEKIEGLREELEQYYIPCKIIKYLVNLDEKKLITTEKKSQWSSQGPSVQFLAPPTFHEDPICAKTKTLTIFNKCVENPEAFRKRWTGGCLLTPTSGIS